MDDNSVDIARALKDKEYYESLTPEQKSLVPTNPVGEAELSDADLELAAGGQTVITGTGTGQTCQCTASQSGTGGGTCVCCETVPAPKPVEPAPAPLPLPGGDRLA